MSQQFCEATQIPVTGSICEEGVKVIDDAPFNLAALQMLELRADARFPDSFFVASTTQKCRYFPAIFATNRARSDSASNRKMRRPTSVQNKLFHGVFSATQPRKGNRVIKSYGAGDGNRTHVRSLGS